MDAKQTIIAETELCQAMQAQPPIGVQIQMNGGKFAFEKIGLDGELHETDCFGEFTPITDTSDIYGDGSMVSLDELHEVLSDNVPTCSTCKWDADCNADTGGCEAHEVIL